MSKKVLVILLSLICVVGGVLSAFIYIRTDREGPKIQLAASNILYHRNEDTSVLMEGVAAVDDVDGDVTDSLIVEAIYPSADGTKAKIVYAAMDSSNNVTKKQRIVDYTAEETVETGTDAASADGAEGTGTDTGTNTGGTGTTPQATPTIQAETNTGTTGAPAYASAKIAVVNGSGVAGVAGDWQDYLENEGYTSVRTGSYKAEPEDTIIYTDDEDLAQELLTYFPNASIEEGMPVDDVDIALDSTDACVVVGPQYAEVPEA